MGYIAFASAKGSPGVTTTVVALAATWPEHRDLYVAELDPAGGDLVVRFDLAPEPGLVALAAAGRRGLDTETFLAHTQPLLADGDHDDPGRPGQGAPLRRVLVGPVGAEQAAAALAALRGGLSRTLAALDADVLVDCGRLDPGSPVEDVANSADLLVVLARPVVAEVHHLTARLATLRPKALSLLLVGERPYSVGEVAQITGASPLGGLPIDSRAAAALTVGHPSALRALRRSRLLRDARAVSEVLAEWLAPHAAPGPQAAPAPAPLAAPTRDPAPPPPPPPPPRAAYPDGGLPAPPRGRVPPLDPMPPPSAQATSPPASSPAAMSPASSLPEPPKHFRRSGEETRR